MPGSAGVQAAVSNVETANVIPAQGSAKCVSSPRFFSFSLFAFSFLFFSFFCINLRLRGCVVGKLRDLPSCGSVPTCLRCLAGNSIQVSQLLKLFPAAFRIWNGNPLSAAAREENPTSHSGVRCKFPKCLAKHVGLFPAFSVMGWYSHERVCVRKEEGGWARKNGKLVFTLSL